MQGHSPRRSVACCARHSSCVPPVPWAGGCLPAPYKSSGDLALSSFINLCAAAAATSRALSAVPGHLTSMPDLPSPSAPDLIGRVTETPLPTTGRRSPPNPAQQSWRRTARPTVR